MNGNVPRSNEVDRDVSPWIASDLARREFTVMAMYDFRALVCSTTSHGLFTIQTQIRMTHVHRDRLTKTCRPQVIEGQVIPIDGMGQEAVWDTNTPCGIRILTITNQVVLWVFRREGLEMESLWLFGQLGHKSGIVLLVLMDRRVIDGQWLICVDGRMIEVDIDQIFIHEDGRFKSVGITRVMRAGVIIRAMRHLQH